MADAGNEADKPEESEGSKSSKMKLLVIAVVVLAVLGGGGYFGWAKFMAKNEEAHATPRETPPVIHSMESLLVNLADPGGKRYLKVNMQLLLDSGAVEEEIKARNYAVRDVLLALLSGKAYDDISTPNGKDVLKREVMLRMNRLLTRGQVKEIYFTEFLVQ